MTEQPHNWAGNYTFSTTTVHHPTRVADVQALVARATKVKALGARHSFNAVADSTGELIYLERFDHTAAIDPARPEAFGQGAREPASSG